jgi:hypothetical protein
MSGWTESWTQEHKINSPFASSVGALVCSMQFDLALTKDILKQGWLKPLLRTAQRG